jgi:hypothetical protein
MNKRRRNVKDSVLSGSARIAGNCLMSATLIPVTINNVTIATGITGGGSTNADSANPMIQKIDAAAPTKPKVRRTVVPKVIVRAMSRGGIHDSLRRSFALAEGFTL